MKTMKKAESGSSFAKLAPPYDKATFADKIAGAKKNAGKAKSGASVKKAKSGIKMKKAKDGIERGLMTGKLLGGALETRPTRTKSLQQKATDNVKKINMSNAADSMKKSMANAAKNGKSMKKCKYGCK
jgi:hypothetical protein